MFESGRKALVSETAFERFREELSQDSQKHFTSNELLSRFSQMEGGFKYSKSHFCHLLRDKLGMHYYKPSPRDYRRPEDAADKLSERIRGTLDALILMGKDISKMAIGFADEVAVQFHCNNARFWSLEAHLPRITNTELGTSKYFGFYALNGQSTLVEMTEGSEGEAFKSYLSKVKAHNSDKEGGMILIWDNAKAHKKVENWAYQENIFTINLPAYSPDLNPIERVWKSCKRWVNEQPYCKHLSTLSSTFEKAYELHKVQKSFANGWVEKMSSIFSWNSANEEVKVAPS